MINGFDGNISIKNCVGLISKKCVIYVVKFEKYKKQCKYSNSVTDRV